MTLKLAKKRFLKAEDLLEKQSLKRKELSFKESQLRRAESNFKNELQQLNQKKESLDNSGFLMEQKLIKSMKLSDSKNLKEIDDDYSDSDFLKRWENLKKCCPPISALNQYLEDERIYKKAKLLDPNLNLEKVFLEYLEKLKRPEREIAPLPFLNEWLPEEKNAIQRIKSVLEEEKGVWIWPRLQISKLAFRDELRKFANRNQKYRGSENGIDMIHLFERLESLYEKSKQYDEKIQQISKDRDNIKTEINKLQTELYEKIFLGSIEMKMQNHLCTVRFCTDQNPSDFIQSQDNKPNEIQAQLPDIREIINEYRFYIYRTNLYSIDASDPYSNEERHLLIKEHYFKQDRKLKNLRKEILLLEKMECSEIQGREPIPESVRFAVWRRDEGKCTKCGSREKLEFDHIIPVSKGGNTSERNIQILCEHCNREKRDKI